jgi:thiamine biosynthesis lipoprotein
MKKRRNIIIALSVILLLLLATVVFLWTRFGQRAKRYECTNYAMGTYIRQTVYGKNAKAAAATAAQSIGSLEDLISLQADDSDVSRLNEAAGTHWISIDSKTAALLQTCLKVAEDSGGAYDPTALPIATLWDFDSGSQHIPLQADLKKYLPYVGYQNLRINVSEKTASLRNYYMGIDLDPVETGAACDEAVDAYRSSGVECGIVAAGLSVGTFGAKADGTAWSIAVRGPSSSSDNAAAMGEIALPSSGFVSTVGTYEHSFRKNGVLYHSLLDPKTGLPVSNGLVSVTVSAGSGALSSALANACFVLGRDKSAALLKKYNAGAVLIDTSGYVSVMGTLKQRFRITNNKYMLQP